jgi:hypothetical protein
VDGFDPPPLPRQTFAVDRCPLCGGALDPEQEWCLRCGAAARTRLASSPSWRTPLVAAALVGVLALGALTAALVKLVGDSGSTAPPITTTVPAAARALAPAPTATAPAPTATAPTASAPTSTAPRRAPAAPAGGSTGSTRRSSSKPGAAAGAGTLSPRTSTAPLFRVNPQKALPFRRKLEQRLRELGIRKQR